MTQTPADIGGAGGGEFAADHSQAQGGTDVGSNRGRDSRNAYLPTVARGLSWLLYELLAEVAAGSAITRPQVRSLSSGILRRLNPIEIRIVNPLRVAGFQVPRLAQSHTS